MHLYVGPCHVVSAEIAVAMAVMIQNLADSEVWGVIHFLQAYEILGYLAKEASSHVESGANRQGKQRKHCLPYIFYPYLPHLLYV